MMGSPDFVVFADDWGRHPSSCQHIFKRIARNHRTLWINTVGMRFPRLNARDIKRSVSIIASWIRRGPSDHEDVIVLSPLMVPSFGSQISRKLNTLLLTRAVRRGCRKYGIRDPVLVTTVPIAADLIGAVGEAKSIYYCVDEFSQWPGMMQETLRCMERELIDKADLVLAVSDKLYHSRKTGQSPTYLLPHGVDFEHFARADSQETTVPIDIASVRTPVIGLCGSFDTRTDFDLIRHIAVTHGDWSIVFIGTVLARPRQLAGRRNVFFLVPRPYELLPNYLKAFDVCIIPYKVTDGSILHSSPVKLREYLAAGKPIVSTPVPEVCKYDGMVRTTEDRDEFVRLIELSLAENTSQKVRTRQEAVRNESWDARAEEFLRHVGTLVEERARDARRAGPIRVMHLSSAVGAGGGPDKTILLSAARIDRRRFTTTIAYLKNRWDDGFDTSIARKAKEMGLDFHAIPESRAVDWGSLRTLRHLLAERDIDILHCHGYKADVLGLLLSRWHKMKLVTTTHGWIGNDVKERVYNWLDRKALKQYERVITVCDRMRRFLVGMGVCPDKLITIHNAIDADEFCGGDCLEDMRAELNLDRRTPVVGMIGRLSREKGVEVLLSMSRKIISELRDVRFLIVGDGPCRGELMRNARELGVEDRMVFLGHRDDIRRVYATLDLLVSLSRTEGLPNVILEALACGVPVVATRVGGVDEIVRDGVNGLLFSREDTDGIERGVVTLLANPEMASRLREEGQALVRREFSFADRMRKMEQVYTDVAGV